MKKILFVGLIIALMTILSSCFLIDTNSIENSDIFATTRNGVLEISARNTYSGIEISLKGEYDEELIETPSDLLRIVSYKSGKTIVAITKPGANLVKYDRLVSIAGNFKSIKDASLESFTFLLEEEIVPSATFPLPEGISVADNWIEENSSGYFLIHAKNIQDIGGSEITVNYDQTKITIDTTRGNDGVEALNSYSEGLLIVNNGENTLSLTTAFTEKPGKNIDSEDIYKIFVNTSAFGVTEIQLSGEVRNPYTEVIPVELTDGVIIIGGPRLLGDFDESGKVDLVDFINFAHNYGSNLEDGKYNLIFDIAPAEDYYTESWAGIYDKCSPDGSVGLVDFIIFARNYGKSKPGEINTPPVLPFDPQPSEGVTNVEIPVLLSWNCSDADGDNLVYDLYFGTLETPPLLVSDIEAKSHVIDSLQLGTTYFWKVAAKDGNGGVTEGPVWSFTTRQQEGITFADENLELAIREIIGKTEGPIYPTDVATISELLLEGRNISDLSGIENLSGLRKLDLVDNNISDLSPLSSLISLEWLRFSNNPINDISSLSGLTNLNTLHFDKCDVSDITVLSNLAKLETLTFSENLVSDIAALANMNKLELFFAGYNFLDYEDLLVIYNNSGIGAGDQINIVNNYMVLSPQSSDMQLINEMLNRGVALEYEPQRHHPNNPTDPYPTDSATEVSLTPMLLWTGTDPDGNSLTFDVLIGESATDLTLAATELEMSQWQVPENLLTSNKTYYWRVTSKENEHIFTEGPVWSFTTRQQIFISEMVCVEGGTFTMGNSSGNEDERPEHEVILGYDFEIGKFEVTFAEYDAFCESVEKTKPSDESWGREERPVLNVSWWDAIEFCNWLSEQQGIPVAYRLLGEPNEGHLVNMNGEITTDITKVVGYRLPTEAEWEYAARGGVYSSQFSYSGSDDADDVGWYLGNSNGSTQEVGQKSPNELGIFDMSGNIWEWCTDSFDVYSADQELNPYIFTAGDDLILRGGAWDSPLSYLRVSYRYFTAPTDSRKTHGFRVARTTNGSISSSSVEKNGGPLGTKW